MEGFNITPSKLGYDTPAVIMFENAGDYKKAFTRQAETTYTLIYLLWTGFLLMTVKDQLSGGSK